MKITALAGGVGGAKLAHGFTKVMPSDKFTVIVNTGDDFEHLGMSISPDLDTVCYTLADISNEETGWGRKNESFNVFEEIKEIGGLDWFLLGDKDIAYHLVRTQMLKLGFSLTKVSLDLERAIGLSHKVLPMCDEKVSTIVNTSEYGEISFQEYFVKYRYMPKVNGFRFDGIKNAKITEEAQKAMLDADAIVICPSNPFVSIYPILSINGVTDILDKKHVTAVSPIIGGAAVKGPLAKLLTEFGMEVNPFSVMEMYREFLNCFYMDVIDYVEGSEDVASGIMLKYDNIFLPDIKARIKLAKSIIHNLEEKI